MADVHEATDVVDGHRKVAVKLFRQGQVDDEILRESFRRETEALRELKHPSIVELIDAGLDRELNRYFIVLDWMSKNLHESINESSPIGWDDFYKDIGQPILQALMFAHSRYLTHRDIKTTNILIDDRGKPKLADFGIAKLQAFIAPGVTLAGFASQPFAPPEADLGIRTYTRDVYGFGVVALDCLTDITLKTREDVEQAFDKLNAPDEVLEVIGRAVSLDPESRPLNAGILLAELDKIQEDRVKQSVQKRTCYIQTTSNALSLLRADLGLDSESEIREQILEDLNSACGIVPYRLRQDDGRLAPDPKENHYMIFGDCCRYHVAVDEYREDHLVIFKAWIASPSLLEKNRTQAWSPPYDFKFGTPRNLIEAQSTIRELQLGVDEHQAEVRATLAEREEQRLFNTWSETLHAKSDLERARVTPIYYDSVSFEGNRATFGLGESVGEEVIGQARRISLPDKSYFKGEVEDIGVGNLVLYISDGDRDKVPRSGKLEFDTYAAEQAIRRQKNALDAVRFDRAVHPKLRRYLIHPEEVRIPIREESIVFAQKDLDEAKQEAVRVALGTQDFLIVEGPPGTGKTAFIAELVIQTLRKTPDARILITSQTHVALDNAIERIQELNPEVDIVRIAGRTGAARVSAKAKNLLLENQMEEWREKVLKEGEQFLFRWAEEHDINPHNVRVGTLLRKLCTILQRKRAKQQELEGLQEELVGSFSIEEDTESGADSDQEPEESREVVLLREQITKVRSELRADESEQKAIGAELLKIEDIAEELVSLSAPELEQKVISYLPDTPEAVQFKNLQAVHFEWEERFGKGPEFQIALLQSSQVVSGTCVGIMGIKGIEDVEYDLCIVDEASKATPTEVLVPLSRSRSYILVGDQRQLSPFQAPELQNRDILERYDLEPIDLKRTLFDGLIEGLPAECKTALTIQHRMVSAIGDLISECFYEGRLRSASKSLDGGLRVILPRPVMWFTTARLRNHWETREGATFVNHSEVKEIRRLLSQINSAARMAKQQYTVGVLTGYSGQKRALERALAPMVEQLTELTVDVNTVDAFQGREADLAIYSVTRANRDGKLGFLSTEERINVALSRGRYYLLIVGDHHFCRTVSGNNPIRRVVEYIESNPVGCDFREVQE